ncbi:hypothetical protein PGTUg99_012183 [Puccinia graminis f. sp. tritici]|uniref:Uncharacterized protein n=1 Tax=Puccinia graminis f. sp. tritici TaxID=56615 RepID=A0A5B0QRG7_PUCGR|nr:hypothetical protein PGTUg99_012183 [Puccinia graminis f. sp. tritici]
MTPNLGEHKSLHSEQPFTANPELSLDTGKKNACFGYLQKTQLIYEVMNVSADTVHKMSAQLTPVMHISLPRPGANIRNSQSRLTSIPSR